MAFVKNKKKSIEYVVRIKNIETIQVRRKIKVDEWRSYIKQLYNDLPATERELDELIYALGLRLLSIEVRDLKLNHRKDELIKLGANQSDGVITKRVLVEQLKSQGHLEAAESIESEGNLDEEINLSEILDLQNTEVN